MRSASPEMLWLSEDCIRREVFEEAVGLLEVGIVSGGERTTERGHRTAFA